MGQAHRCVKLIRQWASRGQGVVRITCAETATLHAARVRAKPFS